ncbi:MAG: fibronectin type III domain-containing protein, partial [Treponema sp.]|nr:fibronectin type III domain-containing protein [Treponema sp.]
MRKITMKMPSVLTLTLSLFLSFFVSCKNEYITAPTPLAGSSLSRNVAPQNVNVTNGREKIYLSWQELTGASRYYIYGTDAATPREEDFIQLTQTTATSIELDVSPGSTVWYKVSAVDSSFNETKKSLAVRGSTLARPEITAIENYEDKINGEISVSIDWFMANCNRNTYLAVTEYDIKYIPEGGTEQVRTYRAADLDLTHVVLENLDPHTKYTFQVIARNTSYGDTRESLALDQETLHRLRPAAPENLVATHGSEKNKVILTFTLPEGADILKKSDGSYKQVPLKFEIYRKESSTETWPSLPMNTVSIENYKKGDTATYEDSVTDSHRGIIYDYKVKSIAVIPSSIRNDSDYTFMESSENSASVASGWAMKAPALYIKDYTPVLKEDGNSYAYATMGLNFIWDNFHEDSVELENMVKSNYKYWLYSQKKEFTDGAAYVTHFEGEFDSITSLNQFDKTFVFSDDIPDDRGYYKFTVCIVSKNDPTPEEGSTVIPEGLEQAVTAHEQIVTNNKAEI